MPHEAPKFLEKQSSRDIANRYASAPVSYEKLKEPMPWLHDDQSGKSRGAMDQDDDDEDERQQQQNDPALLKKALKEDSVC